MPLLYSRALCALAAALSPMVAAAQRPEQLLKAAGTPVNPKVAVSWNRYHDAEGLRVISRKIATAYPDLARYQVIGKSTGGKDIWCLTITDFRSGNADKKPGMYLQGNLH